MHRMKKVLALVVAALLAFILAACSTQPEAQQKETETQQDNYAALVAKVPAHTMTNAVTRKTINFWIDTWNKPGQLAYVYLQNADGDMIGYYVMDGPPVSMCTSLTPNYRIIDNSNGGLLSVPAPGMDGVYYSGGECNTYYGKDATTGAFIEYTVGMGINVLLYTQPLPNHPNVQNLAPAGGK